jgi:DNA-binding transcriptional regulator YiaG
LGDGSRLTQEAMADLLNVSQAVVSKMERRRELYIGSAGGLVDLAFG